MHKISFNINILARIRPPEVQFSTKFIFSNFYKWTILVLVTISLSSCVGEVNVLSIRIFSIRQWTTRAVCNSCFLLDRPKESCRSIIMFFPYFLPLSSSMSFAKWRIKLWFQGFSIFRKEIMVVLFLFSNPLYP